MQVPLLEEDSQGRHLRLIEQVFVSLARGRSPERAEFVKIPDRALRALLEWCRANRHLPIKAQHHTLQRKMQGHDGYLGITGNFYNLAKFHEAARRTWRRSLAWRS